MLKKLFVYSVTKFHNLRQAYFFQSFFVRLAFLLNKLLCFIRQGGHIFFESHCADLNRPEFLKEIKKFSELSVAIEYETLTDCKRRHSYIFKKR